MTTNGATQRVVVLTVNVTAEVQERDDNGRIVGCTGVPTGWHMGALIDVGDGVPLDEYLRLSAGQTIRQAALAFQAGNDNELIDAVVAAVGE